MCEPRQKVPVDRDDLIGLAADFRYSPGQVHVLVLAIHAAEGVAGQRTGRSLAPSHDDARIKTARERDTDALPAIEIPRQAGRESVAQLLIVVFRVEWFLFFPFARVKVGCLLLEGAAAKTPD